MYICSVYFSCKGESLTQTSLGKERDLSTQFPEKSKKDQASDTPGTSC